MKYLATALVTFLALCLLLVPPADAGCFVRKRVVAVTPVVIQKTFLFTFVGTPTTPIPVLVAPAVAAAPAPRVDPVEARLKRIEASLDRLARPAPTEGPPLVLEGPPAVSESVRQAQASAPVDIGRLALVFRNHCSECHTGPHGRDGVNLFDAAGVLSPNVSKAEINRAVRSGRMPKGKPVGLSQEEKALVAAWAAGG